MTNDSGKRPREFWIDPSLIDDEEDTTVFDAYSQKPNQGPLNFQANLIHVREVTDCPNCERLEGKLEAAHHWFDVTTKSNGNLIEENKRLKTQLAMCKEVLEFYADADNHNDQFPDDRSDVPYINIRNELDCYMAGGKRARETLAKLDGAE